MMFNNILEEPYNKFAPDASIPIISKSLVKSKLSNKFHEFMENLNNYQENVENNIHIQNSNQINDEEFKLKKELKKNSNNTKNLYKK